MIEILIFQIHIIAILYAFTKNWQNGGFKEGLLAVLVLGLIFIIGWALTSAISILIYPENLKSIWFTQDTLSLILLIIPESIFYYYFYIKS